MKTQVFAIVAATITLFAIDVNGSVGVISCNMTEMKKSTGSVFSMAPANMDMVDDMMTLDSMKLDFLGNSDEAAAVFMKSSSKRVTTNSGASRTVWCGTLQAGDERGIGFSTIVQSQDGSMSGTFTTPVASYSIMADSEGYIRMKMTLWADFPPESDAYEPNITGNQNITGNITGHDITGNGTDAAAGLLDAEASYTPESAAIGVVESDVVQPSSDQGMFLAPHDRRFLRQGRGLQSASVIRVLVIWTNTARCSFTGESPGCPFPSSSASLLRARTENLEEETNNAMQAVGVNAAIEVVDVRFLTAASNNLGPDSDTLDFIGGSGVARWRQSAQADLVAVITGPGRYCGVARLDSFQSTTSVTCLDGFTFSHELGHNMGALHSRSDPNSRTHRYSHGYRHPSNQFRTMMAYNCDGGCQRIPYFSADGYTYRGQPIGSPTEDNARRLRETTPRVATRFGTR